MIKKRKDSRATGIKWFVTIVASLLFIFSTIYRVFLGQDADKGLCWVFLVIAGLVWGANFINYFVKHK